MGTSTPLQMINAFNDYHFIMESSKHGHNNRE